MSYYAQINHCEGSIWVQNQNLWTKPGLWWRSEVPNSKNKKMGQQSSFQKVWKILLLSGRFFSNFVAFSEYPNFKSSKPKVIRTFLVECIFNPRKDIHKYLISKDWCKQQRDWDWYSQIEMSIFSVLAQKISICIYNELISCFHESRICKSQIVFTRLAVCFDLFKMDFI